MRNRLVPRDPKKKPYMANYIVRMGALNCFVGLAYQGEDIVFSFIIEYSSLTDFGPY